MVLEAETPDCTMSGLKYLKSVWFSSSQPPPQEVSDPYSVDTQRCSIDITACPEAQLFTREIGSSPGSVIFASASYSTGSIAKILS